MKILLYPFLPVVLALVVLAPGQAAAQKAATLLAGDEYWDNVFGGKGMNADVNSFAMKEGILYVAGEFSTVAGSKFSRIARWDGAAWSSVGAGLDENAVYTIAFFRDELYAGGIFYRSDGKLMRYFAKYNGSEWVAPGPALDSQVDCLLPADSVLYLGGSVNNAGDLPLNGIGRWDGARYHSLAGGVRIKPPENDLSYVSALAMIGNDLYAGGDFNAAGTVDANDVARWDGSQWWPLGSGIACDKCIVTSMAVMGGELYVAGSFSAADGVPASNIARWDGKAWHALGSGTNNTISALAVMGDKLYAGGFFTQAGGVSAPRVAMWDGSQWHPLGSGTDGWVKSLFAAGGMLYAGGRFDKAGGKIARKIARWNPTVPARETSLAPEKGRIGISPNPARDKIEITGSAGWPSSHGEVKVEIFDLCGKKALTMLLPALSGAEAWHREVDISHLPSGLYLVKTGTGGGAEVQKLVKR